MYISREQLNKKLTGEVNGKVKKAEERIKGKDRTLEEKVLSAVLSETDTQKNVAALLGISQTQASTDARGLNNTQGKIDTELVEAVKETKGKVAERVSNKAIDVLAEALTRVSNGIETAKVRDASAIALDMTKIYREFNPLEVHRSEGTKVLIVNQPKMNDEKDYPTIEVSSNV